MRTLSLKRDVLVVVLAATISAGMGASQAGWKEYSFPKDGFAARYPGEPITAEHPYQTRFGSSVIERVYAYDSGGIVYAVAVADFGAARPGTDAAIDEAADRLIATGR